MIAAYRYLRRLEHRLQMINDEQTHSIPEAPETIANLAALTSSIEISGCLRAANFLFISWICSRAR